MTSPFIFVLSLVGMIMGFIYLMSRSGIKHIEKKYPEEDTQIIQEINRGLMRMEERIESLETLVSEQVEHPRAKTFDEVNQETPPPLWK